MPARPHRRAYKEVRLQQLRSFCETARLGSFGSAAASLGVSQPTVWEQVHALEREFGVPLIESHRRGCRLTEAGRLLADLALPVVAGADSLKRSLLEQMGQVEEHFVLAAPQRILVEDLSEVIAAFRRRQPRVRLKLLERPTGRVAAAVEAREADLGVTTNKEPGISSPRLVCEPAYELDVLLLTPARHPLTRRRTVQVKDLARYPIVNAAEDFSRPAVAEQLRGLGAFDHPERNVEAVSSAVIRHCVAMGFGIGLVLGRPAAVPDRRIHEHVMRDMGRPGISLVWRKGVRPSPGARAFADLTKELLGSE